MMTILMMTDPGFLAEPAKDWPAIPSFLKLEKFVKTLPMVNDACERLLKRTTDYKDAGPMGEQEFQNTLQVVEMAVDRVKDRKSKKALKESLS